MIRDKLLNPVFGFLVLILPAWWQVNAQNPKEEPGSYCIEKCTQSYNQKTDSLTTLNGSREPAEIDRKIKLHNNCIACIYEKWLVKIPDIKGKMIVRFSILPDGSVAGVEMRASSIPVSKFTREFLGYVSTWRFGEMSENPDTLRVDYPFTFRGDK